MIIRPYWEALRARKTYRRAGHKRTPSANCFDGSAAPEGRIIIRPYPFVPGLFPALRARCSCSGNPINKPPVRQLQNMAEQDRVSISP